MSQYQIAVLVGSIRRDSFNRQLANASKKLAPRNFYFTICGSTACRSIIRTRMEISPRPSNV